MLSNPYQTPQSEVADIEADELAGIDESVEVIRHPWLQIWTRPRATIRYLAARQPVRYVSLLAVIAGFAQNLSYVDGAGIAHKVGAIKLALFAAVLAPISGWVNLYLGALALRWTGRWLGGHSSTQNLRCAMAWAGIPLILLVVCFVSQYVLLGDEAFLSDPASLSESTLLRLVDTGLTWLKLVFSLWSIVILVNGIAQLQAFSAWRAMVSFALAIVVLSFSLMAVIMAVVVSLWYLAF